MASFLSYTDQKMTLTFVKVDSNINICFIADSFDVNSIDYFWKPKVDVIVLDPEMSEFELSDYKGERKQVNYVIGKVNNNFYKRFSAI